MEDQINFESRIDFTDLNEKITRIRERMGMVIIGQREVADLLLTAMLADGHILIEGVPGIAKTLMAKVMARMLDVTFNRIQFTPDLMPSDILGTSVFLPAALSPAVPARPAHNQAKRSAHRAAHLPAPGRDGLFSPAGRPAGSSALNVQDA